MLSKAQRLEKLTCNPIDARLPTKILAALYVGHEAAATLSTAQGESKRKERP